MPPAAFLLLRMLNAGGFHARDALLRALHLSSGELDACARALQANGVSMQTDAVGYSLTERMDLLDAASLETRLRECGSGVRVDVQDECASTNAVLLDRAADEGIHAQAVVCELQSAGRGRRGSAWQSGLADSLTFSLGWRLARPVQALSGLSLAVAVACVHSLEALDITDVAVKWPNDLMRAGAKLGGILIEIARSEAGYTEVVIGVGLNVHVRAALQASIDQPVTTVTASGRTVLSRNLLLAGMLHELEVSLRQFERNGFPAFKSEWLRHHVFQGRRVRMAINEHESVDGLADGVADDGALLVLTDGGLRSFHVGDVSLREAA